MSNALLVRHLHYCEDAFILLIIISSILLLVEAVTSGELVTASLRYIPLSCFTEVRYL